MAEMLAKSLPAFSALGREAATYSDTVANEERQTLGVFAPSNDLWYKRILIYQKAAMQEFYTFCQCSSHGRYGARTIRSSGTCSHTKWIVCLVALPAIIRR